jgi:hypothetical protein
MWWSENIGRCHEGFSKVNIPFHTRLCSWGVQNCSDQPNVNLICHSMLMTTRINPTRWTSPFHDQTHWQESMHRGVYECHIAWCGTYHIHVRKGPPRFKWHFARLSINSAKDFGQCKPIQRLCIATTWSTSFSFAETTSSVVWVATSKNMNWTSM